MNISHSQSTQIVVETGIFFHLFELRQDITTKQKLDKMTMMFPSSITYFRTLLQTVFLCALLFTIYSWTVNHYFLSTTVIADIVQVREVALPILLRRFFFVVLSRGPLPAREEMTITQELLITTHIKTI
jgi:hypothetical protein